MNFNGPGIANPLFFYSSTRTRTGAGRQRGFRTHRRGVAEADAVAVFYRVLRLPFLRVHGGHWGNLMGFNREKWVSGSPIYPLRPALPMLPYDSTLKALVICLHMISGPYKGVTRGGLF